MMRGAMDMNRSSARGTGTPAPKTGLPDGFKPNMPIVGSPPPAPKSIGTNPAARENMPNIGDMNLRAGSRPHTPATNFGGRAMRMKKGGDVGMHRMPDGKMMKDSAHKKHGGEVKKLSRGGGIAKRGTGKTRMC